MFSAITWIPAKAAKATPRKYAPSADELNAMKMRSYILEEKTGAEKAQSVANEMHDGDVSYRFPKSAEDVEDALDMDNYDDEDEVPSFGPELDGDMMGMEEEEEENESDEDFVYKESDAIMLAAHSDPDDEHYTVEVHVYDQEEGSLYVHHDFMLPAMPLCVEWMDCAPVPPSADGVPSGSFAAIGMLGPLVEVWDLDVVDSMEPVAVLGRIEEDPMSPGMGKMQQDSHTHPVLGLSWNRLQRNLLASGSADKTIRLWDVCEQKSVSCLDKLFTREVQTLAWHPFEARVLASGSFGGNIAVVDVQSPASVWRQSIVTAAPILKAKKRGRGEVNVESVVWNPHEPRQLLVGSSTGFVLCYDIRKPSDVVYRIQATRGEAVNKVCFNQFLPEVLATAAEDGTVKVWDMKDTSAIEMVTSKHMGVGRIFGASFYPSLPWVFGCGGDADRMSVWDMLECDAITARKFTVLDRPAIEAGSGAVAVEGGAMDAVEGSFLPSPESPEKKKSKKKGKKSKKKR